MARFMSNEIRCLERRTGRDQRRNTAFFTPGRPKRRRTIRRQEDRYRFQPVDHYRPGFVAALLLVVGSSLMDAFLTLHLVAQGASELNPLLAAGLERGPRTFLAMKYFLTSVAVFCLAFFERVRLFGMDLRSQSLAYGFAGLFGLVIAWQLYLLWGM